MRNVQYLILAVALSWSVRAAADDRCDRDHARHCKAYILATGRRDPRMYAIDLERALAPASQNTPHAIVSRSKPALDRLDGRPLGDSANLAISEDGKTAYVINHHGAIDNAEFVQHGGRGNIAVMNVQKMLDPRNDNTAAALERHVDSGWFGSVGIVLLPDLFVVAAAESHLTEDGGNRVMFIDRRTGSLRGMAELKLGTGPNCPVPPRFPVPFVSPAGPPSPVALLSPDPSWGCYPDTNGLALGRASDGKRYLFGANGGTDDVSVIDLARGGSPGAEVRRVLVGTSDPNEQTRPFIPSITPDGEDIIVPNFRSNNVSIVSLSLALAGDPGAEVARIPLVRPADPDGVVRPARPKGSAVTPDGRYAVISAGARTAFEPSGIVYIIDLRTRSVVGTVTGVGNDPYGLAVVLR